MRKMLMLAAAAAILANACSKAPDKTASASQAAPPKPALGAWGVDLANFDEAVKPGDDFFRYVNGTWIATFKMPADKAAYGAFDRLGDKSDDDVHGLLDDLEKTTQTPGATPAKVADFYASWMDEDGIEKRGVEPLKPWLDKVSSAKSKADIVKLMSGIDYASPVGLSIQPDPKDATKYAVWINQSGLGLPTRDYYLKPGASFDKYRTAYKAYAAKIFALIGDPKPTEAANQVFELEKKLASVQWTPEQQRDVQKTTNSMSLADLEKLAPAFDWKLVLAGYGLGGVDHVVVGETTAVRDGAKLVESQPVDVWRKYLSFHFASNSASALPKSFDEASFEFFDKTMQGAEKQRERWKRGVSLVSADIGEGVGEAYVKKYFPPENKAKMDALVKNLLAALKTRIEQNQWMDEATRTEALKKLATFDPRIGYPAKFRDFSALTIEKGKLFEDILATQHFEWDRRVKRLNDPVDRSEWGMVPQQVNAYYDPPMNQITFPAAILQPPFFDPNADPAVNYGAIGAVIGHEIGHGFDDQGAEFDEAGKLRNWWTKEAKTKFKQRTDALGRQYDSYCPLADGCVKGALTMGENIGDLGGIQMALTAYHLSLGDTAAPVIDGKTGDQRFFLAFGQIWGEVLRDDYLRQQMMSDPHAPGQYRTNGVVRNVDAWYQAFGVKEGDKLYLPPDQRVHIW